MNLIDDTDVNYNKKKNNTKKRSINYRICCVFSNNIGKWFMCA